MPVQETETFQMTTDQPTDEDIDASGLKCPLPVLKLQKRLKSLQSGQTVRLISTDPSSKKDVRAFCAETGHSLLQHFADGEQLIYLVKKC